MRSARPSRSRPSEKAVPSGRAYPFLPAEGLPTPARSHRFACAYNQSAAEQKSARIDSGDQVAVVWSDSVEFIFLALPEEERCDFHWQKKNNKRQPGTALVMVNTGLEIDEAGFAQSMAQIKIADGIDVSAGIVNPPIANRKRAKEIEKTGHEIAQTRTQIQGIGCGNNRESPRFEHAKDFAEERTRLLEVFDGFDAGDQAKATIEIGQFASIEIDDVHPLSGIVHQRISIIAGNGPQPETRANGANEFAFAATNVEPFAGQGRLDICCRDCGHHSVLDSRSA